MFGYHMIVISGNPYYAAVCKYGSGCNTFIATTEPNRWRNRRKTGYD
jgi:hypothetical protein